MLQAVGERVGFGPNDPDGGGVNGLHPGDQSNRLLVRVRDVRIAIYGEGKKDVLDRKWRSVVPQCVAAQLPEGFHGAVRLDRPRRAVEARELSEQARRGGSVRRDGDQVLIDYVRQLARARPTPTRDHIPDAGDVLVDGNV